MKKNNRKGFTLVELLAVVVILLAISVIAISSISAAIERNKAKQNAAKYDVIESYARIYFQTHRNNFNSEGTGCIDISQLDLSNSEEVDADGKLITGSVVVSYGREFTYSTSPC